MIKKTANGFLIEKQGSYVRLIDDCLNVFGPAKPPFKFFKITVPPEEDLKQGMTMFGSYEEVKKISSCSHVWWKFARPFIPKGWDQTMLGRCLKCLTWLGKLFEKEAR